PARSRADGRTGRRPRRAPRAPVIEPPPEVPAPVSLQERIQSDVAAAMRSGDSLRRDVLRMAQNAIYAIEKRDARTLSEDEVIAVLAREAKTRRESVKPSRTGVRDDLAEKEEAEIAILGDYLPQPLTDDEVGALIDEAIAATG